MIDSWSRGLHGVPKSKQHRVTQLEDIITFKTDAREHTFEASDTLAG
jgi:hypothetical protein